MDTLSRITFLPASYNLFFPTTHALSPFPRAFSTKTSNPLASVLRAAPTSPSVSDAEEDILQMFFKERELSGDFISRVSDTLWQRKFRSSVGFDISNLTNSTSQQTQQEQIIESNSDDSFLKLSRTQEWLLGDKSAPTNKKATAKILQDSRARQKKLNILKYESLKREILLVSVGIGLACSGYCLITLSVQAAISYAIGVFFSCLYLLLLYQHADNLSSETVPQIFTKKKSKKIGIRSEDLQDLLERSIKLVPAMFGMFVYKAAVLVQVYRDNEELQLVFPENEDGSRD